MNNRNFKVYTARPVQLALGTSEGSTTIYAKLKNGGVWAFTAPSVELANAWIEFIKRQGTITLNGWKCVRKKPAQPKRAPAKEAEFKKPRTEYDEQADIEHATKMWEFEKSGDREGMFKYLREQAKRDGLDWIEGYIDAKAGAK